MKQEEELVSIITPMYNSEKYIKEMIKSVREQSYTNWELLIIDDCSSDKSCSIVEKISSIDGRIRLIRQDANAGPAEARNKGIQEANGRFIAFLDSDDLWHKDKLKIQIKYMIEKKAAISCTGYNMISEDGVKISEFQVPEKLVYKDLLKKNSFSCDTLVYDKNMIESPVFIKYEMHEDYIAWLNLIKKSSLTVGINKSLACYRLRDGSRSSNKIKGIYYIWKIYRNFEKFNIFISLYYTLNYIINGVKKYYIKL